MLNFLHRKVDQKSQEHEPWSLLSTSKQEFFRETPDDEILIQKEIASHSFYFQMKSETIFPSILLIFRGRRTAFCRSDFASLCGNNSFSPNCRKPAERTYRLCNHFHSSSTLSSIFYVFPSFVRSHLFFCRISSAVRKRWTRSQVMQFLFSIARVYCSHYVLLLLYLRCFVHHDRNELFRVPDGFSDQALKSVDSRLIRVMTESYLRSEVFSPACLPNHDSLAHLEGVWTRQFVSTLFHLSRPFLRFLWWKKRKSIVEAGVILCHSVSYSKHFPEFRWKFIFESHGRWQKFYDPWTPENLKHS